MPERHFEHMIFFIIVFLFCLLTLYFNRNDFYTRNLNRIPEYMVVVLLCVISGTRYNMGGSDIWVYTGNYNALPELGELLSNLSYYHSVLHFENGYLILSSLCKTLGFDFYDFCFLHSLIFYSCMYFGLRRYIPNFNFFILIFLYKIFFYNTMISMRQSLTVAIFFVALKYIEQGKALKYLALCALALPFHNGSYILPLLYFLRWINFTRKRIIWLSILLFPTAFLTDMGINIFAHFDFILKYVEDPMVQEKVAVYVGDNSNPSEINIFHLLEFMLMMYLLIRNYKYIIREPHAVFIIKLFMVLLPIFTIFRGAEIITREKDYFTFTYAVLLFYLSVIRSGKYKTAVYTFTILLCGFGFFRFINLFDNGHFMNYRSWLFLEDYERI